MERSFEYITDDDLGWLCDLTRKDIALFFERNPRYQEYKGEEVLIALCQGAAMHYIDRETGVKDFDVWVFYPKKVLDLPYRRRGRVDSGLIRFGVPHELDLLGYEGRQVDVMMRSDYHFNDVGAAEGVFSYLCEQETVSATFLSHKAVVGLYPESVFSEVLWWPNQG